MLDGDVLIDHKPTLKDRGCVQTISNMSNTKQNLEPLTSFQILLCFIRHGDGNRRWRNRWSHRCTLLTEEGQEGAAVYPDQINVRRIS